MEHDSASEHGNGDRDAVADAETDGRYAGEGRESSCVAEVDETEKGDYDGGKEESVEWKVEGFVDSRPVFASGNGAVTSESPSASEGYSEGADTGKSEDAEDDEEQTESSYC